MTESRSHQLPQIGDIFYNSQSQSPPPRRDSARSRVQAESVRGTDPLRDARFAIKNLIGKTALPQMKPLHLVLRCQRRPTTGLFRVEGQNPHCPEGNCEWRAILLQRTRL